MRVYGSNEFSWKDNRLYLGKKYTGFSVMSDEPEHLGGIEMFFVVYPDGVLSKDYYNLSRAKQHCVDEAMSAINTTKESTQSVTGEFK